jgi:hypothetical protein
VHRPEVRSSSSLAFSVVVMGELLFGFRHGSRFARNLSELDAFHHVSDTLVRALECDVGVRIEQPLHSQRSGSICSQLLIASLTLLASAAVHVPIR